MLPQPRPQAVAPDCFKKLPTSRSSRYSQLPGASLFAAADIVRASGGFDHGPVRAALEQLDHCRMTKRLILSRREFIAEGDGSVHFAYRLKCGASSSNCYITVIEYPSHHALIYINTLNLVHVYQNRRGAERRHVNTRLWLYVR